MRHRMIAAQSPAALAIDAQFDRVADLQGAVRHGADMDMQVARFPGRVAHRHLAAGSGEDRPGVTDLAARLGIEWGLIDDQHDGVAGPGFRDATVAIEDREHDAFGGLGLVAEELAWAD